MKTTQSQSSRALIVRSLAIAAIILGTSLTVTALSPEYLSDDLARRLIGVMLGAVVLIYANAVPKALSPMIEARCNPADSQAIRRFTGWSLVLGGAAYSVAWMVAPIEHANAIAGGLLCFAVMIIIVRIGLGMTRESHG